MSKQVRILLVDDDEDNHTLFIEAVKDVTENLDYACVTSGEEALRILKETTLPLPDFIFLDLRMPRMDGKDCLKQIKKIDRAKDIPVIIYTTLRREEDVIETQVLGAAYFLEKPDVYADLKKSLANIITGNALQG